MSKVVCTEVTVDGLCFLGAKVSNVKTDISVFLTISISHLLLMSWSGHDNYIYSINLLASTLIIVFTRSSW